MSYQPLFRGVQASGTTIAVPVPIVLGAAGVQVSWDDATTAASFAFELSSYPADLAPVGAGGAGTQVTGGGHAYLAGAAAQFWVDSGETIAAVAAGAAGSFLINASGIRQRRGRLLITAAADCSWIIWPGAIEV
jgi:hypothetical protein